jgi:4-diphosphocytidyl-2-C-methyl-D-erythritol kinase
LTDTDSCRVEGNFSCSTEQNLIYRAFTLFKEATGITGGLSVGVEKRIPEGAGLGGGSSDAAATLIGLNRLYDTKLEPDRLAVLGAQLGSDIPFFCTAELAYVCGRGEEVYPEANARRLPLILILPSFSVSTSAAYGWLDEEKREAAFRFNREAISAMYLGSLEGWNYFNSFTPVLKKRYPEIGTYLEYLAESGACLAEVSGSGSALFGVYPSKSMAHRAAKGLKELKDPIQVLTIETLDRFEERILQ